MTDYDFRSLNDKEFEALATDLLGAEYGARIERFKPGKDAGVDGRWFAPDGGEMIVQCKHWVGSGYDALLRQMRTGERPKVDRLSPTRYVLVTSVPLSRANKRELAQALAPHVRRDDDVVGPDDLNAMLVRHPHVERVHFKLWLSSAEALTSLLNHAVVGRSGAELEEMRRAAALYVTTADHELAWRRLEDRGVVILTGAPGIGKTTLARELVLEHVAQGYDLVVIEESVTEAESVFRMGEKQIFYFDDFLGSTYHEVLTATAKRDSHVEGFMRRVTRDATKRFVLTSRTHIFSQATLRSERYAQPHVLKSTYELAIGGLGALDRARILYNHIWHSALGPAYVDELYVDKRYLAVVRHPNFNPRLVAFALDADRVGGIPPDAYWRHVRGTLANPSAVWEHVFTMQLDQACRDLTYLTVLSGHAIEEHELRAAFLKLPPRDGAHAGEGEHQFRLALRQAVGAVLTRTVTMSTPGLARIGLFNPSVADYVFSALRGTDLWAFYFPQLRILNALVQLEQLRDQPSLGRVAFRDVLRAVARAETERAALPSLYSLRVARLLADEPGVADEFPDLLRPWFVNPPVGVVADGISDYMQLFAKWQSIVDRRTALACADDLTRDADTWDMPIDEPAVIAAFAEALRALDAEDAEREVRGYVLLSWKEHVRDVVDSEAVLSGYYDPEEDGVAERELRSFVSERLRLSGFDLTASEVEWITDAVDVREVIGANIVAEARTEKQAEYWRETRPSDTDDTAALEDVFDRSGVTPNT